MKYRKLWLFGALGGDIAGSPYEFNNHLDKDFDLLGEGCFFTDDSVLTVACADAILSASSDVSGGSSPDYAGAFHRWGRDYPGRGYGGFFRNWLVSENPQPYDSYGNGSAMRVSPVGFVFDSWDEVMRQAKASAECTHNHPEGIKGAQATAGAIYLARTGCSKEEIRQRIGETFDYDLSQTPDELRPYYRHLEEAWFCQGTVPQAICCFLASDSYEDTLRTAISIGGDSDTLAAIAGSIALAHYGKMKRKTFNRIVDALDDRMLDVCVKFQDYSENSLNTG